MTWTFKRECRAIVNHATRCRFCRALLTHSRRRRDRDLLEAAEALAWLHVENDAQRAAFSARVRPAR
jgi:hypothetical protein